MGEEDKIGQSADSNAKTEEGAVLNNIRTKSTPRFNYKSLIRNNYLLIALLLFALIIRMYFFLKTYNQALWWDEADYLNLAKHFAYGLEDISAPWRARGFSLFYSFFYILRLPETAVKFIPVIFSLALVYLTYYFGKLFYNKYVGLIAGLIMAVFYEGLFWSMRYEMGLHAAVLWAISALLFWKGYCRKGAYWQIALSFGLASFGVFAYESTGFIFAFFGLYILITEQFSFLKNKRFWVGVFIALIVASPFLYYNYSTYGHIYPRFQRFETADFTPVEGAVLDYQRPFLDLAKDFFLYFTTMPSYLTIFFFIGLLVGIFLFLELLLSLDLIVKGKEHSKDLFILLWLLIPLIAFSFVVALTGFELELRLIFSAFPAMFIVIGRGFYKIYELIQKLIAGLEYKKAVAVCIIILLLVLGVYIHLTTADNLIEFKKQAYSQEPFAGKWLKDNTNESDYIAVCNQDIPWYFYTERKLLKFGHNSSLADEFIANYAPKYIVLDAYQYDCAFDLYETSSFDLIPVKVFFQDEAQTQPIIIIYAVGG